MKTEEFLDFFHSTQRSAYTAFMTTGAYDQDLIRHVQTSVLAMDGLRTSLRTWATELERAGNEELGALLRQFTPSVFDQPELPKWHHPDWLKSINWEKLAESIKRIHQTTSGPLPAPEYPRSSTARS